MGIAELDEAPLYYPYMTRFGWMVLLGIVLVIAASIGVWYVVSTQFVKPAPSPEATSTPQADLSDRSIYTNGEYGFSVVYSGSDTVAETFSPWRASGTATGTPLLSITDPDGSVRIGASKDAKEVKVCEKAGPAEQAGTDLIVGSTTLKAFVHDQLGTENETRITSYRTVHEGACVALETFQPLTDGAVAGGARISEIVSSFSFARP